MKTAYLLLTVLFIALAACGDGGEPVPAEDSFEELPYDDDEQSLSTLAQIAPPRGQTIRITPTIRKRSELSPELRDGYFTNATELRGTTWQGVDYQFYQGSAGAGAIYVVHGVAYITYGALLAEWARYDYERSPLGFPESDPVADSSGVIRQKFTTERVDPSPDNGGLKEIRNFIELRPNETQASWFWERWHLHSLTSSLIREQQPCFEFSRPMPVGFTGPIIAELWCGPLPPEFTDGYVEPTPEGSEVGNI